MHPANAPMSLDAFWEYVSVRLGLDHVAISRETLLREQLGLDSLQMHEVVLAMEQLGAQLIEEMIPFVYTVGDLYDHYVRRTEAEARWR